MQSVGSEHAAGMHRAWADSSGAQAVAATATNAATQLAESRPWQLSPCLSAGSQQGALSLKPLTSLWRTRPPHLLTSFGPCLTT